MNPGALYLEDAYCRSCEAQLLALEPAPETLTEGGAVAILDRTPFFARGGGQPGDQGLIKLADGRELAVVDTWSEGGRILHRVEGAEDDMTGAKVQAGIDWPRRHRLMRMHSCLHLLCSLIDAPVTGSSVGDGRGRVDFDLPESTLDKEELNRQIQRLIQADHAITSRWAETDELACIGSLSRSMEGLPSGAGPVRLVEIAGIDLQTCCGTHVARTAEIGSVQVGKIEKKSRHNRRVNLRLGDI